MRGRGHPRGSLRQGLLALWAVAMVAFNFPMLIVWDSDVTVFGLPLLPVALFAIWGGLIVALAVMLEGPGRRRHRGGAE